LVLSVYLLSEALMAQVIVRNLDEGVVAALKQRAQMHGRSLEQELRDILTQAAKPERADLLRIADRIRAMTPQKAQEDSAQLLREDRDNR
jgi:plasmid stability protein